MKIPFEQFYNKKEEYNSLKICGCLCYIINMSPHKEQFDSRAYKCVFIGIVLDKTYIKNMTLLTAILRFQ